MSSFVPPEFIPPSAVIIPTLGMMHSLKEADLESDYQAVMSSINIIKLLRGGDWPSNTLTKEEDRKDLCWHEIEFSLRASFAYAILAPSETEYLGCLYIYPPSKPWLNAPPGADAVVNLWITQQAYNNNIYLPLFTFVKHWVQTSWPFKHVYYSNQEIPN